MINEELRLLLRVYYSHYVINEGLSTIGDIILERIDCFVNKGECGVVLFIVLIESNDYERSLKSLEFTPIASKMRRDLLETEALKEFQRFQ